MKKLVITIALLVASVVSGRAQDRNTNNSKGYTRQGDTFVQQKTARASKQSDDQITSYTWKDSKGNTYPIVLHTYTKGEKAGKTTCYVVKTSAKTGKEYKYYIPNGEAIAEEIIKENL